MRRLARAEPSFPQDEGDCPSHLGRPQAVVALQREIGDDQDVGPAAGRKHRLAARRGERADAPVLAHRFARPRLDGQPHRSTVNRDGAWNTLEFQSAHHRRLPGIELSQRPCKWIDDPDSIRAGGDIRDAARGVEPSVEVRPGPCAKPSRRPETSPTPRRARRRSSLPGDRECSPAEAAGRCADPAGRRVRRPRPPRRRPRRRRRRAQETGARQPSSCRWRGRSVPRCRPL